MFTTGSRIGWSRGGVFAVAWAVLAMCLPVSADEAFTPVAAGVRYRTIGTYDQARLAAILDKGLDAFMGGSTMNAADLKGRFAAPRHAVTLYEVQFDSVIPEWENQPTLGSGLLAIPADGRTSHPLVSYQHGTVFGRDEVPSRPDNSYETQLALAAFASQGYAVIGADYFGLGPSQLPNCYMVPQSTVQAMLDHHRASQAVLAALGQSTPQFFVWGWSQGGWCTMQFLRRLETLGIPVTAAATVSAPVGLAEVLRWRGFVAGVRRLRARGRDGPPTAGVHRRGRDGPGAVLGAARSRRRVSLADQDAAAGLRRRRRRGDPAGGVADGGGFQSPARQHPSGVFLGG